MSIPGPSPRRHGFDSRSVLVGFEVDEVALGQRSFCMKCGVPNISIMPSMLYTHLNLDTTSLPGQAGNLHTKQCTVQTSAFILGFKGMNSSLCHKYTLASVAAVPAPTLQFTRDCHNCRPQWPPQNSFTSINHEDIMV